VTLRVGARTVTIGCDYLACGFDLVPNLELAALLGCARSTAGVQVDQWQESSVPGVYCAGEITGIGGLDAALVEGQIAGFAATGQTAAAHSLFRNRAAARSFAGAMRRAFALRAELRSLPEPDTFVCRCEDVSLRRISSHASWKAAKLQERCGMGACQGRICGAATEFLCGWSVDSVRPPVSPAPIGVLAQYSLREREIST
jgi:NADPH-dependent 2,4-dienoyl-CoA reductase/sulfur reductase-like enzyme